MGEQYSEDKDNLQDLLHLYEQLKQGHGRGYLEEDSFERIILHFQDQESYDQALEAAQWAIDRYPYSAMLKIKLADVLILVRRFKEAEQVLEEAALLDNRKHCAILATSDSTVGLGRTCEIPCGIQPPSSRQSA